MLSRVCFAFIRASVLNRETNADIEASNVTNASSVCMSVCDANELTKIKLLDSH